jgi:N-hydroxyarylamine O-acetyltransferase
MMDTKRYLRRFGIEKNNPGADAETLRMLQRRHLLRVPFENLDIHWKRPITLETEKFYDKIVGEKRGGFCYELNGLFQELLAAIGFESKIVSARVSRGNDRFGAEYDHLALLTRAGGDEYLTDVGFGSFAAEPLKFVLDVEQIDENGVFRIGKRGDGYYEVFKKAGGEWRSEYIFKEKARNLGEFAEMCRFHQSSPESHFTRGKVCSLMTAGGRKTLTDHKYIETVDGRKNETDVVSEDEFNRILAREFEIVPFAAKTLAE